MKIHLATFYSSDLKRSAKRFKHQAEEMGIYDYADRLVMYYNQREKEWLSAHRKALWEVENPQEIYGKGIISNLIDKKAKDGEGCFVERKGRAVMKGRVFNLYEKDPTQTPQWMFQPFSGAGSVEDMKDLWEDGLNTAFQYQKVMLQGLMAELLL